MRDLIPLLLSLLVASCALEPTWPPASLDGLPDGLHVQFTVDASVVAPLDTFIARLEVTNAASAAVSLTSGGGCLATPLVLRDGRRVPFAGTGTACSGAITTFVFEPGETIVASWRLQAALDAVEVGDVHGTPAQRGRYHVRAEFHTTSPTQGVPAIETALRVR